MYDLVKLKKTEIGENKTLKNIVNPNAKKVKTKQIIKTTAIASLKPEKTGGLTHYYNSENNREHNRESDVEVAQDIQSTTFLPQLVKNSANPVAAKTAPLSNGVANSHSASPAKNKKISTKTHHQKLKIPTTMTQSLTSNKQLNELNLQAKSMTSPVQVKFKNKMTPSSTNSQVPNNFFKPKPFSIITTTAPPSALLNKTPKTPIVDVIRPAYSMGGGPDFEIPPLTPSESIISVQVPTVPRSVSPETPRPTSVLMSAPFADLPSEHSFMVNRLQAKLEAGPKKLQNV